MRKPSMTKSFMSKPKRSKSMPKRAMLLAAGLGKRMRPLTDARPKPLVEVKGRALVDHALDRLVAAGVELVVINLHYRGDQLREHLAKRRDVEIRFSDETAELLDTGGGVVNALPLLGDEPFFAQNTDSIWVDGMGSTYVRMAERFDAEKMDSLLLMAPTVSALGYWGRGDFTMDELGHLSRREEARIAPFVWTGVQIVHPRLFKDCPTGPFSTNLVLDRAIESGRLYGIRHDGIWMHVGCPNGLAAAEEFLSRL